MKKTDQIQKIYLDHGASTPTDKEVLETMLPYFSSKFGNPSSLHFFGEKAGQAVEEARKKSASFFKALPEEIIFTSGATESNNLAVKGAIESYYSRYSRSAGEKIIPHVITTVFEHSCVFETCQKLEKQGLIEATYVSPQKDGIIRISDIQKTLKKNTVLVSVMYVNNEIGTLQPVAGIGRMLRKIKKGDYPLFHTDATQAVNYFNCDVKKLGVDMLSMSAHKIYGPKGAGALFVRKGIPLSGIQDGGSQEFGKRAGTLNVPGIAGLGKALEIAARKKTRRENEKILKLRDRLIEKIEREVPGSRLNGSRKKRSPNNANFSFQDAEGESLLLMLSAKGVACSTGSACSSGSLKPSRTLLAIGLRPEEAHSSLRFTLGKDTTKEEIDRTVKILKKCLEKLRKISGNILKEYYAKKTKVNSK